ncbi:MAG: response regulator [Planctomycetes bacterium]|nr:response regulator [Planctomycetota bacterium]
MSEAALAASLIGAALAALLAAVFWRRLRTTRQELADSRRRWELLFESLPGSSFIVDADAHRILAVNDALCELTGCNAADLVGQPCRTLCTPDSEAAPACQRADVLDNAESQLIARSGKTIPVLKTIRCIDLADRRICVECCQDLSAQRQADDRARQGEKMQAVGRLAGGVAHDFNNQLTVIKGYCDLLMLESDEAVHSSVEQISLACQQASQLTAELLSFSRRQAMSPEVFDPGEALRRMQKALSMIGEDIKLDIDVDPAAGRIQVDPNRFQQALMNLAINARDAMPDGGRLRIAVAPDHPDGTYISTGGPIPSPTVLITVSDNGSGIDAETREHIFEPFFTTKQKGKGTGLGLSMVYGFVTNSGGQIDVDSEPGGGATFRIRLPQAEAAPASKPDASAPHDEAAPTPATILVAEDDPAVRLLVTRILEHRGYTVLPAADVEEALGQAEHHGDVIDLLITDVVMPNVTGPELARQLIGTHCRMKVLYISGHTPEVLTRHGVDPSDKAFLRKPFSPQDLIDAVAAVLANSGEASDANAR